MTDTIITVRGEHSAWYAAERAIVRVGVHAWGPKRDGVLDRARRSAGTIRDSVEPRYDRDAGPVTWWASDSVRVWAERPWNDEGRQLPPVFHAAQDFTVKFRDFEQLTAWVETTAEIPDAVVASIEWDLTESTRTSATAEVRSRAVKDAVAKATVFAQSIGLRQVKAIALADPGMLGEQGASGAGPAASPMLTRGVAFKESGAPALALKAEEIAVSATVDARFVAS
ncbi:MAG TPA: SIMPL domain-containing protein [Rhodoglobus sp.]|nr:SIMPL domain-containing protein [Rhodoglobus sp.]